MKTLAIIDPTSMVGCMVFHVLKTTSKLLLVYSDQDSLDLLEKTYGGVYEHTQIQFNLMNLYEEYCSGFSTATYGPRMNTLFTKIDRAEAIINCATIVKPYILENPVATFFTNTGLPHMLSRRFGNKLIHLSTDCVFDGLSGAPYTENSPVNPTDLYGFSRSLGEPSEQSLVIRTSTIGPEIHNFNSLIDWVKKQSGRQIKGFTRHLWNGITTKQFAKSIDQILSHRDRYPHHGLYHIFGSDVSKFDMVTAITNKYNVNVSITPDNSQCLDRRLRTVKVLNGQLHIPPFDEMLDAL